MLTDFYNIWHTQYWVSCVPVMKCTAQTWHAYGRGWMIAGRLRWSARLFRQRSLGSSRSHVVWTWMWSST